MEIDAIVINNNEEPVASYRESYMRLIYHAITIVAVILVVIGNNQVFRAEAVEHHGFKVKDAGLHGGSYTECLQCHGSIISKDFPPCMPVCFLGKSHPLNQAYPPPDRKNEFWPARVAEQYGIKFVDGKTDCISCHNLMKDNRQHLRFENGPKLCEACHNK